MRFHPHAFLHSREKLRRLFAAASFEAGEARPQGASSKTLAGKISTWSESGLPASIVASRIPPT
jgi:hypothetical protein